MLSLMRKPPRKGTLAFAEDGSIAFGEAGAGSCFLRAQRIGALLAAYRRVVACRGQL